MKILVNIEVDCDKMDSLKQFYDTLAVIGPHVTHEIARQFCDPDARGGEVQVGYKTKVVITKIE